MGLGSSRSMRNLSFSWLSPHVVSTCFVLPTTSFYITTLLNVAGRFKRSRGGQGFALFRLSLSRVGSSGFSKRMRIPVPARVTVERWLCSVPGWWAAFCETEADSRDGGPLQLDQKSSCESRRCQTNGRHVSAACRYGTNSIFQGFQWKPVTGGLPPPIMPLATIYRITASEISRNKLITNLKNKLLQKLCSLVSKHF